MSLAAQSSTGHRYDTVSVAIVRPQIGWYGPRFAVSHVPASPIRLGGHVDLKIFYFTRTAGGAPIVEHAVDTTVMGSILAIESATPDSIEFVIRNDTPGHPFAYLIVPRNPRFLAPLPLRVRLALALLRPFLYCTYWRENNTSLVAALTRSTTLEPRTDFAGFTTAAPSDEAEEMGSTAACASEELHTAFSDGV